MKSTEDWVLGQVSEEDIDAAFREYRGSEEEAADLLRLYTTHGGRMSVVGLHVETHLLGLLPAAAAHCRWFP